MFYKKNIAYLDHFYLFIKKDNLTDAGQQFIDFILSPDGQAVVAEAGAIPVK